MAETEYQHIPRTESEMLELLNDLTTPLEGNVHRDVVGSLFELILRSMIDAGYTDVQVEMAKGRFKDLASRLNAIDFDMRNINVEWINKNLGKLDQTFMTEEFLQQMAGTTPINAIPSKDSITINQLAISKVTSANKFDKNTAVLGALNASGQVVANSEFYTSDHIKVNVGDVVRTSHNMQSYALYNSSGNVVTVNTGAVTSEVTIPANVTTIRATFYHTNLNAFMLAIGTLPATYEPIKKVIDDNYLDDIDGNKVRNRSLSHDKLSFLTAGKNMLNPDEVIEGYYIDPVNGKMMANEQYNTTGVILGNPNQDIVASTIRFVAFYDSDGNLMPDYGIDQAGNPTNYTFKTPYGSAGFQVSYSASTSNMQIEKGTQATSYEAYANVLKGVGVESKNIISTDPQFTKSSAKGNLSNGQQLTTEANSLKKNKTLSFSAKISSFNEIRLGHGETEYGGSYIEITPTAIKVYDVLTSATFKTVLSHGFTISGFIDVLISVDKDAKATIRLMSSTGAYESEPIDWWGYNGKPFCKSLGSTLTDCELVFDTSDFSKPIYFFGDSYSGLTTADRWPHYIRTWGYDNWLINGYPGQASVSAKGMLDYALSKKTPKILIWGLGMNDGDSGAVNASWLNTYNQIKAVCNERGIELVLCTIPNTPTINNTYKNTIIRASGYRYIDFAKAVGSESAGSGWYTGMLHADQVHPTALGAKKLALRAIQDVPELAK